MSDSFLVKEQSEHEGESFLAEAMLAGKTAAWRWYIDSNLVQVTHPFAVVTRISEEHSQHLSSLLNIIDPADGEVLLQAIGGSIRHNRRFFCRAHLLSENQHLCFIGRAAESRVYGRVAAGIVLDIGDVDEQLGSGIARRKSECVLSHATEQLFTPAWITQGRNTIAHQRQVKEFLPGLHSEQLIDGILPEQNHLLYSIINNTNSAITVKSTTGKYLLANQEFSRLVRKGRRELRGKTDFELFDKPIAEEICRFDRLTIERKELFQVEELVPSYDGGLSTFLSVRFPIYDKKGEIYALGKVSTDITQRKLIEQTVEDQRSELRVLLDSMHSCIWYLDRWGVVKSCNRLANQWLSPTSCMGRSFFEFAIGWDDAAERQREIMQVVRTGLPLLNSIERWRQGDRDSWFSVDKIPITQSNGRVSGVLLAVNDITESVKKEQALRDSEARYRAFISNSSEAIWCYEVDPPVDTTLPMAQQVAEIADRAVLTECNDVLAKMFGSQRPEDIIGIKLSGSGSKNYIHDLEGFVRHSHRMTDKEITCIDRQGRQMCLQISATGITEDEKLLRVWGTTRDITERQRYFAKLEYQATHDSLTLLPNRNLLYREMDKILAERTADRRMALLLIDLDRFKEINDTLGHHAGDKLLKQIGPRLEIEMAELSGIVARLGGDEFAIFLSKIRNNQQAVVIGHRFLDSIRQEFDLEGYHTEISASIGISICPDQAEDVSTLMRYADVAMYRAKTGMLGVSVYNAEFDPHSPKRLSLMGDLGRAIREDQLILHFQPKVDIAQKKLYGFEALLRWDHPELGFIPPGEFIPIAEMTDLIHSMTLWVLDKSLRQCSQWKEQGLNLSVAVNLSARNLLDEKIAQQIALLLKKYNLCAQMLELEITESTIMVDPARALHALRQIHDLGVQLSIDDFGTGYSSLAYLKQLPVQSLKIDYSFVLNMLEEEQDEIIVNSTIHLAHNLGLKVVAEGVETDEALLRLAVMGCDHAQGYFISRPIPASQTTSWALSSGWSVSV